MTRQTLLAVLLLAAGLFAAPAAKAEAPLVAVVDVDKVLMDSKAAQSLQKQIQAKKEAFQKEFSAKESELKKTETSLMAEREKLPAEEFSKKWKAYEEKIIETRKLFQKRTGALEKGLANARSDLHKYIAEVTADVAEAKKYDIVIKRESTILFDKDLDITNDVISKLDAKVTDIPLKVE